MLAHSIALGLLAVFVAAPTPIRHHDSVHKDIAALRRQIATSPAPASLHLAIADLERRQGHVIDARRELKLAERAGALPFQIEGQLAACAMAEGDFEASEQLLTSLLRDRPGDLPARRMRAQVRTRSHKHLAAACDLASIREADPDAFSQEDALALADALAKAGHLQASISSLDRVLQRSALQGSARSAVLIQRAVELETELGAFAAALRRTETMCAAGVAPHVVAALRGDLYLALGQSERARTEWQAAATALRPVVRRRRRSGALRRDLALLENKLARLAPSIPTPSRQ